MFCTEWDEQRRQDTLAEALAVCTKDTSCEHVQEMRVQGYKQFDLCGYNSEIVKSHCNEHCIRRVWSKKGNASDTEIIHIYLSASAVLLE